MAKKEIDWDVSIETDEAIGEPTLYERSCELCGTRGAGKHPMPKVCWDCICGTDSPNFKLSAKYQKENTDD